jgi:hypothetical protein
MDGLAHMGGQPVRALKGWIVDIKQLLEHTAGHDRC